jgi:DNA-binding transcriptional ArsR family regulator
MEEIADTFVVARFDQLRAIADPLRARILEQLVRRPMTMSQLGETFGETTAKMHYHVRELEKHGFIHLVEKREHGGFIEKYYRAVAKEVHIAPDLLRTSPTSEVAATVQNYLDEMKQEMMHAIAYENAHPESPLCLDWESDTLWLNQDEYGALLKQVDALLEPFRQPQGRAGERRWITHFLIHTKAPAENKTEEHTPGTANDQVADQESSGDAF